MLFSFSAVTKAADVYSLGVTIYEVFTWADVPFNQFPSNMEVAHFVMSGERPDQPGICPDKVWAVVDRCWAQLPADRCSAADAAQEIGAALHGLPPTAFEVKGQTYSDPLYDKTPAVDDLVYSF
jgi:serine/threonine protein kinase